MKVEGGLEEEGKGLNFMLTLPTPHFGDSEGTPKAVDFFLISAVV